MNAPIANPMQTAITPAKAAKITGLSHGTILRCFDQGLLKGYKVPGSNYRRIPIENLYKFMREHGLPGAPEPEATLQGVDTTMTFAGQPIA